MSLPPLFLDELRSRVSLAGLVGKRVTWETRKTNAARGDYWAPCPFHQEKTASFHVDEPKGRYYCFGCHAKGDAVTFLRETENLGFMEAVERLAAEAGMTLPERDPASAARAEAAKDLAAAMEAAVQFYRLQLATARATEARAYLDRRGLSQATRDRFELGFSPEARTALLEHLTGKGFSTGQLVEAGLVLPPREGKGGFRDRFLGRVMFPIRDGRGRAIAFGARAIAAGQEPKYLNSSETPLFDKGRNLYNVSLARPAALKAGTVIVTEGYMDVIALAQAGLDHAVAPLGTAVTEMQLQMLWKLAPEPVVALDGDKAGLAAAHRLIDLALPHLGAGRSLRFALMPAGQDPDDVVRGGGAAAMQALLAASQPIVDLLWTRETEGQVLDSPERRAALDARLKAHLARIADASLRGHWESEIRSRRAALFAPARPARPTLPRAFGTGAGPRRDGRSFGRGVAPVDTPPVAGTRASLLARRDDAAAEARVRESAILWGCLNHPEAALALEHRLDTLTFHCPDLEEVRAALLSQLADTPDKRLADRVAARLGRDPRPSLSAPLNAGSHLGPDARPELAARAIEEAISRHAAATGRAIEVADAVADLLAHPDDAITLRVRAATEAEHDANTKPLQDDLSEDQTERLEFAELIRQSEARRSRPPRKR